LADRHNMHREMPRLPLGYFLTLRTYGTWLHGDERGSVHYTQDQYGTPVLAPNPTRVASAAARMRHEPFLLDATSAAVLEQAVEEVCTHRQWRLFVVHARTNHVHIVVGAALSPERMMNDFKVWGTRHLRENGCAAPDQTVWAEHGSTPYLWTEAQLRGAIDYAKNWQGGPLQRTWDDVRKEIDEREEEHDE
jgi:REP element-mobilizing transposase RayT